MHPMSTARQSEVAILFIRQLYPITPSHGINWRGSVPKRSGVCPQEINCNQSQKEDKVRHFATVVPVKLAETSTLPFAPFQFQNQKHRD